MSTPKQPVAPQHDAPRPAENVQYVVQAKALDGVGGWLIFWMIIFALGAISFIMAFFTGLDSGSDTANAILTMIFSPVIAIASVASIITIATRKKIGLWVSVATIGITALYGVISTIISAVEYDASTALTVGGILVSLLISSLCIMYFFMSKRVKQTLTQ
jgi:uncharacterized membrane protein YhaH (DUF805 family)